MMESSTPMATVNHIKLYFGSCASHMSTPFKEYFLTLNEYHTVITLDGIASGITIRDTGTVKYVMLDNNSKPYTMMVEKYLVSELKHRLVSPQDLAPLLGGNALLFDMKNIPLLCFWVLFQRGTRRCCDPIEPCHLRGMRVWHLGGWTHSLISVSLFALCDPLGWIAVLRWIQVPSA